MTGKTKYIAPPYNLTLVLVAKRKFLEKKMTAFLCVLDQSQIFAQFSHQKLQLVKVNFHKFNFLR